MQGHVITYNLGRVRKKERESERGRERLCACVCEYGCGNTSARMRVFTYTFQCFMGVYACIVLILAAVDGILWNAIGLSDIFGYFREDVSMFALNLLSLSNSGAL